MKKIHVKEIVIMLYVVIAVLTGILYGFGPHDKNDLVSAYVAHVIIIYLLVSVGLLLLNKSVMTYSDKISFYSKSLGIIFISVIIVIVALTPLKNIKIINDIIGNIFINFKFLFSASLILDVFIQLIKIWKFRKGIVSIDEVVIYTYEKDCGEELKKIPNKIAESEVKNIVNSIFFNYDYLKKNKKIAVDSDTAERVKDIYIAKHSCPLLTK